MYFVLKQFFSVLHLNTNPFLSSSVMMEPNRLCSGRVLHMSQLQVNSISLQQTLSLRIKIQSFIAIYTAVKTVVLCNKILYFLFLKC